MTEVEELADFVCTRKISDISDKAKEQLKIRILDALACAFGALGAELIHKIRCHINDIGGNNSTSLIGGGKSSLEHGTFYNSAVIRYIDFNDSYLAKGETCHPSDNIAAIIAASEYKNQSGEELLTALAIAYQVQCRLCDEAPVRAKGFDHTTQGAYALACGIAKALQLNREQTANAIAICGTSNVALRVSRTGALSNWKGLAYPQAAFIAMHSALLAMRGITGPLEVFEGNKGFKAITGPFLIDWRHENLEIVRNTIIKRYNAEIHAQSCLEGILELVRKYKFSCDDIAKIDIEIFDVAYNIIGGGEEGDKKVVNTKEEADHSLRYLVAAALLDSQVMPAQFAPARINSEDVQDLMKLVHIRPNKSYSELFPKKVNCSINITLKDGKKFSIEKHDHLGFHSRPFTFQDAEKKFKQLSENCLSNTQQDKLIECVKNLENIQVKDLTKHLIVGDLGA